MCSNSFITPCIITDKVANTDLTHNSSLWEAVYYHSHTTDIKTEAKVNYETCQRLPS